jgi:putative pyruvate formate lyase activating enzyme
MLAKCRACPRDCGVNRLGGELGYCGIGKDAIVSSAGPHFGEEAPLVGRGGSGTIFLAGCNLGCIFCQNYETSHLREGRPFSTSDLAAAMLRLEQLGCHNINLVTPSHVVPQIMMALRQARDSGLTVPTVYNSGGYDKVESLRLLDGHLDIYMPDAKYMDSAAADRYSGAKDYPQAMTAAIKEMHRQVGDLLIVKGIAVRGLLVRHLVMPGMTDDSLRVIDFLANEISPSTYVNVMGQYHPCFRALQHAEIAHCALPSEVQRVRAYARRRGLRVDER